MLTIKQKAGLEPPKLLTIQEIVRGDVFQCGPNVNNLFLRTGNGAVCLTNGELFEKGAFSPNAPLIIRHGYLQMED